MRACSDLTQPVYQVRLWEDREHSGCWRQACCATVEDPAMCVSFSPDSSLLATGVLVPHVLH
jgi:hypothetical protein